jgi:hypothetical protein
VGLLLVLFNTFWGYAEKEHFGNEIKGAMRIKGLIFYD